MEIGCCRYDSLRRGHTGAGWPQSDLAGVLMKKHATRRERVPRRGRTLRRGRRGQPPTSRGERPGAHPPVRGEAWNSLPVRARAGGPDVLHRPAAERPGLTIWSPSGDDHKAQPRPGQGLARRGHARSLTLTPARSYVEGPPTPGVSTASSWLPSLAKPLPLCVSGAPPRLTPPTSPGCGHGSKPQTCPCVVFRVPS